ncbi:DUF4385 family protein [Acinetobacter terrae]|nr:DUF4385 family protein [Acinetobacter terrae]
MYRIGPSEQNVLLTKPYKSEILPPLTFYR